MLRRKGSSCRVEDVGLKVWSSLLHTDPTAVEVPFWGSLKGSLRASRMGFVYGYFIRVLYMSFDELQPYTKLTIARLSLFIPSVKLSCSS